MIVTGNWSLVESTRQLATMRGEDPDAAETKVRAEIAARAALPRADDWPDDSGFESKADRERERLGGWGAGEERALTDYEQSRGL